METSGFYNGGPEYGQEEFNRYFNNIYRSGIAVNEDNTMQYPITIGSGQVSVGVGFAILRGFYHNNDSAKTIALPADSGMPRIYRVLIRLDIPAKDAFLIVRSGTAASTPSPPALVRNGNFYELSLGQYKVTPEGVVTLVKDERADVTVCGPIRPKSLNEYDTFMKDAARRFEEWFASQQGEGGRQIYIQATEPEGAVAGSIWIQST